MKHPSTIHLELLPEIEELKKVCKAIAVLDAIICPEWDYRYYSYNSKWSDHEQMASMRDGMGDEFLILFNEHGAVINGFASASAMNGWEDGVQNIWEGVLEEVPEEFQEFIYTEPIPSIGTTFCIWRKHTDKNWQIGDIDFPNDNYGDGSEDLIYILDGKPETYKTWAEEYYEEEFENDKLPLELVEYVYSQGIITKEFVLQLNPNLEAWEELIYDLEEIGFPHSLK